MAIDTQIQMGNTSQTTQRKATTKNNDNQRKHSDQHGEKAANKQTKQQGTNLTGDMQTDESRTAEPWSWLYNIYKKKKKQQNKFQKESGGKTKQWDENQEKMQA